MTTGITGTLYTSEQNEERPEAKPRFPNVFGFGPGRSAPGGGGQNPERAVGYQKALYEALRTAKAGGSLQEVIEDVPRTQLTELGPDGFTALFIPN